MATLSFKNLNKVYDNNVQAVFDFNLDIKDKEFIVFVGPSGCGKSTTLRMVAGLEEITWGELYIDDVLVNYTEPKDRGIAMVFQNYALYPHMTVYNNMAFSLKIRKFPVPVLDENGNQILEVDRGMIKNLQEDIKDLEKQLKKNPNDEEVSSLINKKKEMISELENKPSKVKVKMMKMPKEEIIRRVTSAAEILGLTDYLKRKPAAMSGGQRQRVALGRAIVRNPKVFLMDEPLSNLDAKLRVQMRTELKRIHNEVGATTIYVTHDQTEAMTMADRIVVMKSGYVQQIATPKEIYEHPANLFVATFVGSPSMNILKGEYDGKTLKIGEQIQIDLGENFKANHDNFFSTLKDKTTKEIERLEGEIKELSTKSKANAKAIEQRKKNLENNKAIEVSCNEALNNSTHTLCLGIRPEDIYVENDGNNKNPGKILTIVPEEVELLGQEVIVYTTVDGQELVFKVPSDNDVEVGKEMKVAMNMNKIHVFDAASTLRIDR